MLTARPREPEWVSWLLAGLWALAIFAAIPIALQLQEQVADRFGGQTFSYLTLAAVAVAAVAAARILARSSPSPAGYVWLAVVASIYAGGTLHLWHEPAEALHFVQYGMLGVLVYRALCHRLRDASIYVVASIVGGTVGMVDELLQWVTPGRFWDERDIWIDFLGAALAQVAIARGLRPPIIAGPIRPASVRTLCRAGLPALAVLAVTLLNTPPRIAWYTERSPPLAFLANNESTMLEYGHRIVDPEAGPFRSRLSLEELRRTDLERGAEAAQVLDRFRPRSAYRHFLERYTPVSDPFIHEARVHLFRRDRHLGWARDRDRGEYRRRVHQTVAWRENRIMERYFPEALRHSSYVLAPAEIAALESRLLPDDQLPAREVESTVSRDLVTVINERQLLILLGLAALTLAVIDRRYGRS